MIQRIALPFDGEVFVCDVCGYAGDKGHLRNCEEDPSPAPPSIQVGDKVAIYQRRYKGGRSWGRSAEPGRFSVRSLSYSQPESSIYRLAMILASHGEYEKIMEPQVHQLRLTLGQTMDGKPYKEGDSSCSFLMLSWDEFLLWQEGDEDKLVAARLLPAPRPRSWWQFWKR